MSCCELVLQSITRIDATMHSRQRSLRVPIVDSTSFVEIFPDELPSDVNDLLDVLKAEYAPLKVWREAAVS